MSGLPTHAEETVNGVDVREQGNALRVATNIPHLVSLGTGRLSTAVTLHPIKQGRVTIGSDPTCDIYVAGTGVCNIHCHVENSHGVVTLYPINGSTLLDGMLLEKPTRLSQGSMLTIGRSNYLRFNHPEEAKLMKSVLPTAHLSMAPIQYQPNEDCAIPVYAKPNEITKVYQNQSCQHGGGYNDDPLSTLTPLEHELEMSIKELSRRKPPLAPRKPFRDMDLSDSNSNSDQESHRPKMSSIMAKVSKFEYYAKSQKNHGRSKFYTYNQDSDISPKVFSSNSLTCNTPAKDVLGGKNMPTNYVQIDYKKNCIGNNSTRNCSYANVSIKKTKVDDIVRNFDDSYNRPPKKVDNDKQNNDNIYGKINNNKLYGELNYQNCKDNGIYASSDYAVPNNLQLPSPSFDRNPQYSPVYANSSHFERSNDAECKRKQAYQDRVKEEAVKEAENARLDEILNMCAEYEKQISSGNPITPTEKKTQNKIITNGSLPRSVVMNNPNFVQTSEGYYKFDTSQNTRNTNQLQSQRNYSTYENLDFTPISPKSNKLDEIGIPIKDENTHNFPTNELSSPIMIKKLQNGDTSINSPLGSPYENLYQNRNLKPRSPNTQSPRSRIKTTFAHKNLPSPQYFVFPTPPPKDTKPEFVKSNNNDQVNKSDNSLTNVKESNNIETPKNKMESDENQIKTPNNELDETPKTNEFITSTPKLPQKIPPKVPEKPDFLKKGKVEKFGGIEKQLSLEEELPMIDDVSITNDLEFRSTKVQEIVQESTMVKNKSFDDVKRELMADIPELEEFEKDLKLNKRDKLKPPVTNIDVQDNSFDNQNEGKVDYEMLKESRRKMLSEIHEIKCKMAEIRSQEDDILRELEMEKALIKGEYDSEIAILNIEQKKKESLIGEYKRIEEEICSLRSKQESRQNEMRDRVEIATLKVERIEKDIKKETATMEELQNAQDILDNESKIYEDLEFQHLEEESELLAHREDIQNDIALLTKKIDAQKSRILTLKSEASDNLTSALDETKILQAEYVRLLNQVEEMTSQVQKIEKELQGIVNKINEQELESERASDSDETETKVNYDKHRQEVNDAFKKIDQMSQSMIITIDKPDIDDIVEDNRKLKDKKGFWERNFDSLSRLKKDKKAKTPDIMSQSLNENFVYNDSIECDNNERFNSLKLSKNKKNSPKSNASKIPTLAALGKIIKKDSFTRKKTDEEDKKNRYVKNTKPISENKYNKSKSLSPDKTLQDTTFKQVLHRKSCGDEPGLRNGEFPRIPDKIPSQDDIDRISKVTIDAPIVSCESDMNSLGRRTLDSLKEVERKRMEMLEEQGCQVIENEREKILELKKRVQDETKKLWDEKLKNEYRCDTPDMNEKANETLSDTSVMSDRTNSIYDRVVNDSLDDYNMTGSTLYEESSGLASSSIEELQVRNSRTDSLSSRPLEDDKRSDDSRPLSNASDFSRDNILSGGPIQGANLKRRPRGAWNEISRPLTRYLPVDRDDFDLRRHIETAGHQVELCPHVILNSTSCRGYLHKLGAKFHTWSKRWFVFDRDTKTFVYYWDKSEKKPRGGAYFQVIEEVYLDHGNTSKSPNPQTTFVVKTRQRRYYLMSPSGEAARIWIDVIFTGAQGYTEYME